MNKKVMNSILFSLFLVLCAYGASAQTVTLSSVVANSVVGGTTAVTVSISGFTNASNYTINLTDASGAALGIVNASVVQSDNNSGSVSLNWPSSNGTFTDSMGYTLYATIHDQDGSQTVASANVGVDNTVPNATIGFTDKLGTAGTTFNFATEVLIDCAPSDTFGLNLSRSSIQVQYPGVGASENISLDRYITRSNTSFTSKLEVTDTDRLGDFVVTCVIIDHGGNLNSSALTFKTKKAVVKSTSPFALPGFEAPVGKVKVSSGAINDGGRLTTTGVSRLIKENGAVMFDIKGEEHTITVLAIGEGSVKLNVESEGLEVTIDAGSEKGVDVNDDGVDDVLITYHKQFPPGGDFADLTFALTEQPSEAEAEDETTAGDDTEVVDRGETGSGSGYAAPKSNMAVTIAVIVIVLIIGYALIKGKKK